MRVLIVNRTLGTFLGGGETFDINVARNLIKMGHEVTIITGKPLLSQPKFSHGDVNIGYLSTPNLRFLEQSVRHISQKFGAILRHIDTYSFERTGLQWVAKNQQAYDIVQPLVRESGGGILLSPGDVEGLAQVIVRLSNDADYRRQLGENGRAYVRRFDWPKIIGKLLRLYKRVIARRSGRDS